MVAETLLLLWIGWSHFGLATDNNALYTFSFLMLLYFAVFSVVSARERHWFWATLPRNSLVAAIIADALTGTVLTFVGLPGLMDVGDSVSVQLLRTDVERGYIDFKRVG